MSLNWKEIDLILKELDLEGSFIQQIVQPGYDTIAFYTYKAVTPKTVLICLAGGVCRIHETKKAVPKNDKPLRFMEFLKAKIKGARINSVAQVGRERIIKMDVSHCGEDFILYIRLWSGAANIILTDPTGFILDSFYRRPKKNEMTGGHFLLPETSSGEKEEKNWQIRDFSELENSTTLSFNEKVDRWYSEFAQQLSLESLLEQAEKYYNSKHSRIEAALTRLETKRDSFLQSEKWKHYGDLILTYGHLIDGSSQYLECLDYDTNAPISIKIDPDKNAQENASEYYNTYKKALSGLSDLEHDIQRTRRELLDLEADYQQLCREPNPIKLQQMLRKQTKPKQQIEKKRPGITYEIDGWTIFVGRTATENDELLRHHVKGQDMWLHARDYAGGYVFIKNRPGKTIPLDILLDAGNLALYHSKARKSQKADLYYTQVKYLRRAKNGPKGLVIPTQEKNLFIEMDKDRLKKIEESIIL